MGWLTEYHTVICDVDYYTTDRAYGVPGSGYRTMKMHVMKEAATLGHPVAIDVIIENRHSYSIMVSADGTEERIYPHET